MNQASLYRDDSSVTATLRSSRPGSFYAGHDRTFVNGGAMSATPFDPQQRGDVTTTNTKIDQLMNMVSSTQQLLFSQQDAYKRLETHVLSLSSDVAEIKQDLNSSGQGGKNAHSTSRCKVPVELSVSSY